MQSTEATLHNFTEYRLHKALRLYVPPILLLIGTIGNTLSFTILVNSNMRRYSAYLYLAVLSFTDTLVLYVGLLRSWVGELTAYDLRDHSDWNCKIINTLGYTVSDYSVWLIIAVTTERYIAVCHPLKAPTLCKRSHVFKVVPGLLVIMLAINSHFFWTVCINITTVEGEQLPNCAPSDKYHFFLSDVWPWIDTMMYSLLPLVVISVMNVKIIYKVVIARRQRTMMQQAQSGSTLSMNNTSGNGNTGRHPSPLLPAGTGSGHHLKVTATANKHHHHDSSSYRLTIMLLTISFAFLFTTTPMTVVGISVDYFLSDSKLRYDLHFLSKFTLARTISELLMYCNHSMNFFLYCATGQKFRQQFWQILCRCNKQRSNGLTTINMSTYETKVTKANGCGNNKKCTMCKYPVNRDEPKSAERTRLTVNNSACVGQEVESPGNNDELVETSTRYTTLTVHHGRGYSLA